MKSTSGKTVPEDRKEPGKSLQVSGKRRSRDTEPIPGEAGSGKTSLGGEKELGTGVPNSFDNAGRTSDILAKSLGISGRQLEKAEAIVEASQILPFINHSEITGEHAKRLKFLRNT